LKAAFSDRLLSEIVTVARRLMGKDFASKLRSQISQRSEIVSNAELLPHIWQFMKKVPTEDIVHAALAAATGADYIVSNNREFLRSLDAKSGFKCVTPKSFVEMFHL
jgi:predicted nucleic acid-binding protein